MTERMGFETNRRIVKIYNNRRITATVGGQKCYFRSTTLEYYWALYLQWLKERGEILDWRYESEFFSFTEFGYKRGPFVYRPDFYVTEADGVHVHQECKGHHDGQTNSKFQRMAKHYPDVVMDLVLQRIPKNKIKGANRRRVAQKYVRRTIDASEIFRQTKGVINYNLPIILES